MTDTRQRTPETPVPTVETTFFWETCANGRLSIGWCDTCDRPHFYPRARCPHCLSARTRLAPSAGRGEVYSYSVMRRAKVPYVIAYVRLEEGVTMLSNIVGCDADAVRIGMPVEVDFLPSEGGQPVPVFRPAAGPGGAG